MKPMTSPPTDLRQKIDKIPRYRLSHLPTPLEFLPRFTQALGGPQIYIKRDDCTGLACGGNKARHNEFLMGDALAKKADVIVWGAGIQSNNCRQTAAACAKAGLDCHLILGRGGPATGPDVVQGNLLLDQLVGAHIEIVDEKIGPDLDRKIAAQAERYVQQGRRPYMWDPAVVKPLAAISYAECMVEILEQTDAAGWQPTAVYLSSAGSTGAGAALGQYALGYSGKVRCIAPMDWPWDTRSDLARIANAGAEVLGLETRLTAAEIDITFEHIPPGYGLVSEGCLEALSLLARTEGILLDPIYTSKAVAGLIQDVRTGQLSAKDKVVFIHTGGTPALFAYADILAQAIPIRKLA
jgi:1-aminocyclopropane-1-carboxylate deaminase/D-cysteine desulfhydrase-like pyridoxal-dependent ACC family enzyme